MTAHLLKLGPGHAAVLFFYAEHFRRSFMTGIPEHPTLDGETDKGWMPNEE